MLNVTEQMKLLILAILAVLLFTSTVTLGVLFWLERGDSARLQEQVTSLTAGNAVYSSANARWVESNAKLEEELQACTANWESAQKTLEQETAEAQSLIVQAHKETLLWKTRWESKPKTCEAALQELDVKCAHLKGY